MVLAFPRAGLHGLAWICMVPLIMVVLRRERPGTVAQGIIAGTVYHVGLIYWVVVSMNSYGGMPRPLAGLMLALFAVFLSAFVALPLWCSAFIQKRTGLRLTLTLPVCWVAAEYVKSWILTGFPWELLGYSQFRNLRIIQIADITGVYGVSFLLIMGNCAAAAALHALTRRRRIPRLEPCCALVLSAASLCYGHIRVQEFHEPSGTQFTALLVQPNIPQDLKWDPAHLDATMQRLFRLSTAPAQKHTDLTIWPESATPFFFQDEPVYQEHVVRAARHSGGWLVFGSPSFTHNSARPSYHNSAFLMNPDGEITARYDKLHLVPWGEYVPLKRLFPFITRMVTGIGDFTPGKGITLLRTGDTALAPLICYEIIFPNLTRTFVRLGGQCIVNITNDAWFGRTCAPYQHLSMAVLRAVENKRFLLRCANTGISAAIAPTGKIIAQTAVFTEASLQTTVSALDGLTVYSRFGDVFAAVCLAASVLLLLIARRRGTSRTAE